ncbi:MAG: hypothetical protein AAB261_04860, partial [Chloroflexota bacterium]
TFDDFGQVKFNREIVFEAGHRDVSLSCCPNGAGRLRAMITHVTFHFFAYDKKSLTAEIADAERAES